MIRAAIPRKNWTCWRPSGGFYTQCHGHARRPCSCPTRRQHLVATRWSETPQWTKHVAMVQRAKRATKWMFEITCVVHCLVYALHAPPQNCWCELFEGAFAADVLVSSIWRVTHKSHAPCEIRIIAEQIGWSPTIKRSPVKRLSGARNRYNIRRTKSSVGLSD